MPSVFDLQRGAMRINKSYQRFDSRDIITTPKTRKSSRTIKLSRFLVEGESPTTLSATLISGQAIECSWLPGTRYRAR